MDAARARDDGPIDQTMAETAEHDDSQSTDHQHDIETGDGEHEQDENDASNTIIQSSHSTAHLKPEEAAAYQLIFDSLAKVRKIDRRHWHHRPIFRVIERFIPVAIKITLFHTSVNLFLTFFSTRGCITTFIEMLKKPKQK